MKRNVALLVFDDVEVLDFAGPFEVFAVTDELRGYDTFNVYTVAPGPGVVRARNGLRVLPDYTTATCPPPHLLIVPGGFGTRALVRQPAVVDWVRTRAAAAELTMSVCTGAIVLGRAGLLDGRRATTHHECFDLLHEHAPAAVPAPGERFVDHGRLLTSAGISSGIDASLHVVARLLGPAAAEATARYMEYRRP